MKIPIKKLKASTAKNSIAIQESLITSNFINLSLSKPTTNAFRNLSQTGDPILRL
jgi:hypothetical protein